MNIQDDPERGSRMRIAAAMMIALSGWLVLSALALDYGESGGAAHNVTLGIFLAALGALVLRNPFKGAMLCGFIAAGGLITAAAPFLYEYQAYTLTMASTLWSGLIIALLSFFLIGEALQLKQPLIGYDADDDDIPARAAPQD